MLFRVSPSQACCNIPLIKPVLNRLRGGNLRTVSSVSSPYNHALPTQSRITFPLRFPEHFSVKPHIMSATEDRIRVSPASASKGKSEESGAVPAHWADPKGKSFKNPWPSFREPGIWDMLKVCRGKALLHYVC